MWVQTSSVTYLADWSQDHLPHYHDETLVTGAHQEIESHVDIMYRVLMILPALEKNREIIPEFDAVRRKARSVETLNHYQL